MKRYRPKTKSDKSVVERVVEQDWLLNRAEGRLLQVDPSLCGASSDPRQWTADDLKQYQLFQRYHSSAQRALTRTVALADDHFEYADEMVRKKLRTELTEMQVEEKKQKLETAREASTTKAATKQLPFNPALKNVKTPAAAEAPKTKAQMLFQGQRECPTCSNKRQILEQRAAAGS